MNTLKKCINGLISIRPYKKLIFCSILIAFIFSCGGSDEDKSNRITEYNPTVNDDGVFVDSQNRLNITQYGITWTFDTVYTYGQFVNGDYWVAGPVTIVGINPPSIDHDGRIVSGAMINPVPANGLYGGGDQGYDSAMHENELITTEYNASLNAARPNDSIVSQDNPLNLPVNSSLVSTISMSEPGRPSLKTASVLTVLSTSPPTDSFRPPYSGTNKTIRFTKLDLDYSSLQNLTITPEIETSLLDNYYNEYRTEVNSVSDALAATSRNFQRVWLDHIINYGNRNLHPYDNMANYGEQIGKQIGNGALMLNLDFSDAEKESLLIGFVQVGIDLTGVYDSGGCWPANGAHNQGRKLPILVAGMALNDAHMRDAGNWTGANCRDVNGLLYPIPFHEDCQTFNVASEDLTANGGVGGYVESDLGLPEYGMFHCSTEHYNVDIKDWSVDRYRSTNGISMSGSVLAAHIMGLKTIWNHDTLFDYIDRWWDIQQGEQSGLTTTSLTKAMWSVYRTDYDCVWTRNDTSDIYSSGSCL
jgi:hypothetical protein